MRVPAGSDPGRRSDGERLPQHVSRELAINVSREGHVVGSGGPRPVVGARHIDTGHAARAPLDDELGKAALGLA